MRHSSRIATTTDCIPAFISPLRSARVRAREIVGANRFVEVHVSTSLEVCEQRDVKGLYKKARAGEVEDFTGISAAYEVPEGPELILDTGMSEVVDSVEQAARLLRTKQYPPQSA